MSESKEMAVKPNETQAGGSWRSAITTGGSMGAIVPQDFDAVWRLANVIGLSGMCPKEFKSPEMVAVAIMHGMEVGLTPMAAMQSIAIINGRPSIWGDAVIGLVRGSGLLESFKEEITGTGNDIKATCTVLRKGETNPVVSVFSYHDAKTAGLWGKSGPWTQYPKRMLQMRARGFALRDAFADVLRGLHIAEEQKDMEFAAAVESAPTPPPIPSLSSAEATQPHDAPPAMNTATAIETPQQTPTEFLYVLEDALQHCDSELSLEEVWSELDPMANLEGHDNEQALAISLKSRFLTALKRKSDDDMFPGDL